MSMIIRHHLPHGGDAPNDPKLIVVHAMAEYILDGGVYYHASEFLDRYELSAHVLVAPNGDRYVCRDDHERAWHARGHNTDSLGIEFLVEGRHDYASFVEVIKTPYLRMDEQYESGLEQVEQWIVDHQIRRITRHSTLSPGRKVDPGDGFPWAGFIGELGLIE